MFFQRVKNHSMRDILTGLVALLAIGVFYNFGFPYTYEKSGSYHLDQVVIDAENYPYYVFDNIWDEAGTKRLYDVMESGTRYVTAVEDATASGKYFIT